MEVGSAQWLYMAESTGCDNLVNTRHARLVAAIKEMRNYTDDCNNIHISDVLDILAQHQIYDPTADEIEYIEIML